MTAAAAPEIDRLVWAVRDAVRARYDELPSATVLTAPTFWPLINLMPFADQLSESFIRRRYIYRPQPALAAFFAELESGGFLARDGDRLRPTERLAPIGEEVRLATAAATAELWRPHEEVVVPASAMARTVLDAGPVRDGLVQVAIRAPEPEDPFSRFWQRLAGLRLLRNEAHVDAWRAAGLTALDVEALTGTWTPGDAELQAPVSFSDRLAALGYVADGNVTDAGVAARQRIEDATNEGVAEAFATIDHQSFAEMLRMLPPTP